MSNLPLPDGWVRQYDPHYKHSYWVNTRANPPRAIWVHPYEDDQFLGEHPEVRERIAQLPGRDLSAPPPYEPEWSSPAASHDAIAEASSHAENKRGVFGRWKDRAIGTKEEREEHRRVRAEQAARAEEQARQERLRNLEERAAYMRAHGGYGPYHPSYAGRDHTAALVLGGLAGGLLLGDIFGGGF